MNHPWQIVIASTDATHTRTLTDILNRQGILPITIQSVQQFDAILARESVGLVFCDSKLADGDYREMVAAANAVNSRAKVAITSRFPDWDEYLEATQWAGL